MLFCERIKRMEVCSCYGICLIVLYLNVVIKIWIYNLLMVSFCYHTTCIQQDVRMFGWSGSLKERRHDWWSLFTILSSPNFYTSAVWSHPKTERPFLNSLCMEYSYTRHLRTDKIHKRTLIFNYKASVTIMADFSPEFNPPVRWRSKHQTKNDC